MFLDCTLSLLFYFVELIVLSYSLSLSSRDEVLSYGIPSTTTSTTSSSSSGYSRQNIFVFIAVEFIAEIFTERLTVAAAGGGFAGGAGGGATGAITTAAAAAGLVVLCTKHCCRGHTLCKCLVLADCRDNKFEIQALF